MGRWQALVANADRSGRCRIGTQLQLREDVHGTLIAILANRPPIEMGRSWARLRHEEVVGLDLDGR